MQPKPTALQSSALEPLLDLMYLWTVGKLMKRQLESIFVVVGVVITIVKVIKNKKSGEKENVLKIESTLNLTRLQKLLFRIYEPFSRLFKSTPC